MEIAGDGAGVIRQECQHEEFGFFLKAMGVMKRHKQVKDTVRSITKIPLEAAVKGDCRKPDCRSGDTSRT